MSESMVEPFHAAQIITSLERRSLLGVTTRLNSLPSRLSFDESKIYRNIQRKKRGSKGITALWTAVLNSHVASWHVGHHA